MPSAYYDFKDRKRMLETRRFWKVLKYYDVYVSALTLAELRQAKDPSKREKLIDLVKNFKSLEIIPDAEGLADEYLREKIIPSRYRGDALHLAIASVNNIDYLVSWNFEHLVNIKTRRASERINRLKGYRVIEIIAPPELKGEGYEKV